MYAAERSGLHGATAGAITTAELAEAATPFVVIGEISALAGTLVRSDCKGRVQILEDEAAIKLFVDDCWVFGFLLGLLSATSLKVLGICKVV